MERKKQKQKNSQPIGTPFKRPAWRNFVGDCAVGEREASVIFWDVSACVAGERGRSTRRLTVYGTKKGKGSHKGCPYKTDDNRLCSANYSRLVGLKSKENISMAYTWLSPSEHCSWIGKSNPREKDDISYPRDRCSHEQWL